MINYEEATARYNVLLAELANANARSAENPDDSELAAAAQDIYDRAQAAYADVLDGYGADDATEASATPSTSEPQNNSDEPPAPAEATTQVEIAGDVHGDVAADSEPAVSEPAVSEPAVSEAFDQTAAEYDLGDFGAPATVAAPAFGEKAPEGVFILTRKPVATRFVPSETPIEELTPISRSILPKRDRGQRSAMSRERNIAGGLPEWSPTPPGEVLTVKRAGTKKT